MWDFLSWGHKGPIGVHVDGTEIRWVRAEYYKGDVEHTPEGQ